MQSTNRSVRLLLVFSTLALSVVGACAAKQETVIVEATRPATTGAPEAGLVLNKEQIEKAGLMTQPVRAASYQSETTGYGLVLAHDSIAQLTAEVATAEAADRQSRAVLERTQQLAGTPGAFPVENLQTAERQAVFNEAALMLAQQKVTAALGQRGPWTTKSGRGVLSELATGQIKLVRATFPFGTLKSGIPHRLRFAHLDASGESRDWRSTVAWDAPADANVPGRSFFTLLRGSNVSEGERLQVWATTGGAAQAGRLIPAAAVVLSNDAYWCFLEKPGGRFVRTAVDTRRPLEDGYFVTEGIAVSDVIVTAGAGLLLARESNPGTETE
jgi:hypothetical protein